MGITLFRCGRCGKPYTNPLTHTCTVKTDFRKRKAAQARKAKTAAKKAKAQAARQRQQEQRRNRPKPTPAPPARPKTARPKPSVASPRQGGRSPVAGRTTDTHDHRECFNTSQGDRRHAAQECARFPCRIYAEGREHGYQHGHSDGYAQGYSEGVSVGYAAALSERH